MKNLPQKLIEFVFDETEEKVQGTSHSGRMIKKIQSMGFAITESRYRRIMRFYKQTQRGIFL
jgi:hypothetical protein